MAYKGKFKPKNPKKYIGNIENIVFRSLKERRMMVLFDESANVIEWASEEIIIPYFYQVDNKQHRYFPDFYVKMKRKDGTFRKMIIEYKPKVQTLPPKVPDPKKKPSRKRQNRYLKETLEYIKNQSKWSAAKVFAESNGMKFLVVTEDDLKRWTGV